MDENNIRDLNTIKIDEISETSFIIKLDGKYSRFPFWGTVISVISFISISLLIVIFTCTVGLSHYAAVYDQNCIDRSCNKQLDLQCINGKCQCKQGYYYEKGCMQKKSYLEKCNTKLRNCMNGTNLVCRDGVCKCDNLRYWNGRECITRSTYDERCYNSDRECLNDALLVCDLSINKCVCPLNR